MCRWASISQRFDQTPFLHRQRLRCLTVEDEGITFLPNVENHALNATSYLTSPHLQQYIRQNLKSHTDSKHCLVRFTSQRTADISVRPGGH